jgi:hypothetical protein
MKQAAFKPKKKCFRNANVPVSLEKNVETCILGDKHATWKGVRKAANV